MNFFQTYFILIIDKILHRSFVIIFLINITFHMIIIILLNLQKN